MFDCVSKWFPSHTNIINSWKKVPQIPRFRYILWNWFSTPNLTSTISFHFIVSYKLNMYVHFCIQISVFICFMWGIRISFIRVAQKRNRNRKVVLGHRHQNNKWQLWLLQICYVYASNCELFHSWPKHSWSTVDQLHGGPKYLTMYVRFKTGQSSTSSLIWNVKLRFSTWP